MTVAALYIDPRGPYPKLLGPELCWDEARDARTYAGPWPVVAHPPCGPWGRLRHLCTKQDRSLAIAAVWQVRACGGVLEHPQCSKLWGYCDLPGPRGHRTARGQFDEFGGFSIQVAQVAWGHVAEKLTWLYFVGVDIERVLSSMQTGGTATHCVSRDAERAHRNGYTLRRTSSATNRRTPVAFAEWLISLAEQANARKAAE